jgi:hypothetical protein
MISDSWFSTETGQRMPHKYEEWVRVWQGRLSGMPSPVLQTQRQAEQLKKILVLNREQLREKMMLGTMQKGFGVCPFDVVIAISDTGIVKREPGVEVPEVCKADQVVERVKEIIQRENRRVISSLNPLSDPVERFSDSEMESITKFFLEYHHPLPLKMQATYESAERQAQPNQFREASPPSFTPPISKPQFASSPSHSTTTGICEICGARCEILWGKYSYYWKCPACGTNMAIKEFCPACKEKMKLRKVKNQFYKYCEPCKTQSLYHEAAN